RTGRSPDHRAGRGPPRPRPPRRAPLRRPRRPHGGARQPPGRQPTRGGRPGDDGQRLRRTPAFHGHRGGRRRPLPGHGARPLGPRDDWFTREALRTFTSRPYQVSPASNRIGLRTEGPALERARPGELPSEGMVLGAVQVPSDGRPVVFLADHPTTGGYPVIAA